MNATATPYVRPARPAGGAGADPVDGVILVEVLSGRLGAVAEPDRTAADTSPCSYFTWFTWRGPAGAFGPC